MKTKQSIICVVAGSTILVLFLAVVLFGSFEHDVSFKFLDKHEPIERKSRAVGGFSDESLKYHFKGDYDTFIKAAKSELSAKGFEEITDPNGRLPGHLYLRRSIEHCMAWIDYEIVRKDPNDKKPIYGWIYVQITRRNPGNIKAYWASLEARFRNWGKP